MIMKRILAIVLATGFAASSTGCIFVHSEPKGHPRSAKKEKCAPAHHWEGGRCVHNGKAKGHKK